MGGGVGATPLVGWLNVFNAELSPKRLWRGPGSQEVGGEGVVVTWCFTPSQPLRLYHGEGEEGDFTCRYAVTSTMTPAATRAVLMFH